MSVKGKKKPVSSDENVESDDEVTPAPKKSNKPKKGGFALLKAESDDDIVLDDELTDEEVEIEVKTKTKEPQGKKSKKAKKKRNDSDEDIDKVLAELQMEYSGVKKETTEEPPKKDEKDEEDGNEDEGSSLKTAAQKKKEKKERQKKEMALAKQQEAAGVKPETKKPKPVKIEKEVKPVVDEEDTKEEDETEKVDKKKKKKDKKEKSDEKEKEKDKGKKGPGSKIVAAMQEQLKKIREEEEKLQLEEEEKVRIAEEAEDHRLKQLGLEQEKKEKKKLKEKERKERLKSEGKLLTAKQKLDKARAQDMLESLKAQGIEIPEIGEKRPVRAGTRIRPKKKDQNQVEKQDSIEEKKSEEITAEIINEKPEPEQVPEPIEDVKDAWDASSSSEDESEDKPELIKKPETTTKKQKSEESSENESDDDDDDDSESESESESEDDHRDDAEKRKQKVRERLEQRKIDAEEKRSLDNLRAAVVCVLGHVDTGKTKILDKLRRSNVQDGEAGGITQQIGATNVPIDTIKEQTKMVKGSSEMVFKLPGLLIIDTPGHESFSNLRSRGSSLCDIAILVVDIMHGLEPQTIESLNLLKSKKTPFIVALNKIDRLYDWQTTNRKDIRDTFKAQAANTQVEFTQRTKEVIVQFAEQGLNAALFYENPDPRTYVSMVPTSAISGEGIGNLLYLIIENCQNLLAKRLMYSEELSATVLEGTNSSQL